MSGVRSGYQQTEVGVIPQQWELAAASTLEPFITSGSRGWAKFYTEHGRPFIRITNLKRTSIYPDLDDLKFVNVPSTDAEAIRTSIQEGDILISITADIGIIGLVTEAVPQPAYINQHIACLRIEKEKADSKFLSYFLASKAAQTKFREVTDAGAKTGINLSTVGKLLLVLPPLPEQQAIAKALGDVDGLIAALEALIAKKRDIMQGAMQDLLSAHRRLPGFAAAWKTVSIEAACSKVQDGTHFSPKIGGGNYLYVTSKNISIGKLDLSSVETISKFEHDKIFRRCDTRQGDVLLTKDGANTGNAAINSIGEPISLLSSVAFLRFLPTHSPEFFLQKILAEDGQQQIQAQMSGNAITRLTLQKIKNLVFFVPTLREQVAIAEVLQEKDAEIAALEAKLAKTRDVKQGMMQVLLTGEVRLV